MQVKFWGRRKAREVPAPVEPTGPLWLELTARTLEIAPTRADQTFRRLVLMLGVAVITVFVARPPLQWWLSHPDFEELTPILAPFLIVGILGLLAFVFALVTNRPRSDR